MDRYLWIIGSSVFIVLACIHLYLTFFTNKFSVRDVATETAMKSAYPVLTKRTTVWKAWVGFNASHSLGAIFFGVINLIFSIEYFPLLENSPFLVLFTCFISCFYLFLSFKYWFTGPRTGILVSTVCFSVAAIILLTK